MNNQVSEQQIATASSEFDAILGRMQTVSSTRKTSKSSRKPRMIAGYGDHRCPRRNKVAVTDTRDVPTKIGNNSIGIPLVGSCEAELWTRR